MPESVRPRRLTAVFVGLGLLISPALVAAQDVGDEQFITGPAANAWQKWKAAMDAVLNRSNADAAEAAIKALLDEQPSPLRVALMADRSIMRNESGGGVLLLEQDAQNGVLKESGKKLAELLDAGREQMNQADDGWYFASVGQFPIAAANFSALVASQPDPVALLEFADRVPKRQQVLVSLFDNPVMREPARGVLLLLQQGEQSVKADPVRIKQQIDRLGGPPRMYENAVARLRDSGEYAVPFMIQALRDPEKRPLAQAIVRTLPKLDRPGVTPLALALRTPDRATQVIIIRALGQMPYAHSVPYLLALREAQGTATDVVAAIDAALVDLSARGIGVASGSAAEAFYRLGLAYDDDQKSVAADSRLATANVWYWRDELLQNIEVPAVIFNEVMAMRCCEEALRLDPDHKPSLALWIAANLRREAQLPADGKDFTRPDNYPAAAYFAQAAGTEYCQMALARAIDAKDSAVALGTIDAIHKTGGPASVVPDAAGRQPLAEALSFPDRMVRIRAALALGAARPTRPFQNAQNFATVINEALTLHAGSSYAVVVEPDAAAANDLATGLRSGGYNVITDASLVDAMQKVRSTAPSVDLIVLASGGTAAPLADALTTLRADFHFASTPLVIHTRPGDRDEVARQIAGDPRAVSVPVGVDADALLKAARKAGKSVGATQVTPEVGVQLAAESANVLRGLGESNSTVLRIEDAEKGLLAALTTQDAALRTKIAEVLGFIATKDAQGAVAEIALSTTETEEMRIAMFTALADGAKRRGNQLDDDVLKRVIAAAEKEPSLPLRTAASRALGALNVSGNPASTIIRNQYGG
jgi:HEAT repeat protein